MSKVITRDKVFYAFSPDLKPVAEVDQGELFTLETHDCFEGQLKSEKDLVTSLDWGHVNPATGPVFIRGAKPGDILSFEIVDLEVGSSSTMVAVPKEGALGNMITDMETTVLKHEAGAVVFKNKIRIPFKPMIGVIGVAPKSGSVPTGTPGAHGGNMDCTLIGKGARVYFTVNVEGALFGCGDFHAVMGDGEIVVCGAETLGIVTFKAHVTGLKGLPTPLVETDKVVATIFSAPTLDEASQGAIEAMAKLLTDFAKIPFNDAGMLMSLVGKLKFCQVVDPEKTVRFEFPKWVLAEYGFRLP